MTTILIGLFPTQKEAKKLATDLELAGFKNEVYIIYINQVEEQKENFWNRIFGGRTPQINTNDIDKLIASVSIKNEEQLLAAKEVFTKHSAVHLYEFDDISLKEAQSLDYLKTKVALRAKSEVYSSSLKHKDSAQKMHAATTPVVFE